MKNITMINAVFACILLFASCAKDRPEQVLQEQEKNVVDIAQFQGKEMTLRTLESLNSASLLSDAATVSADLTADSISNAFTLVSYQTDSRLFNDVPLFALPGQQYTLRYEVTNKYLVVNKVAPAQLIPFHERTFAKQEGDLLIVPIIGYPVTLFKKDLRKNADQEKTNQVVFVPVKTVAEATHMNINESGRIAFDAIKKHNVIPVNFFMNKGQDVLDAQGNPLAPAKEWFYSSTIVGAPPALANSIGRDVTQDFTDNPVSRVKFIKNKSSIMAVNLNIDEVIDLNDENNFNIAIQIPAKWIDYRRKKEGDNELLEEEELTDESLEGETFRNREHVQLNFTQVTTRGGFDTSFADEFVLDDLEITRREGRSYISFVTHHRASGIKTRYTFYEAHAPKEDQTKVYFKDDRDIFGFFFTNKSVIYNHTQIRPEDREKNTFINRYMPEADKDGKRKIEYHFSKRTTNPEMIVVGRLAIEAWNRAFAEAGTGIEITLDESKKVNLGDLRYNIINVVDNKNGGNLLGYGPTIADSKTGEIIAGSSNIYADPFREGLIRELRHYLRARRGLFNKNYITSSTPLTAPIGTGSVNDLLSYVDQLQDTAINEDFLITNTGMRKELSNLKEANTALSKEMKKLKALKKTTRTFAEYVLAVDASQQRLEENYSLKATDYAGLNTYGLAHHAAFQSANKDVIKEIEDRCGEELNEYVSELEAQDLLYNDRELDVIYACINKVKTNDPSAPVRDRISMLQSRVLSTLVHEMGHNFSLRHNFVASTDTKHFNADDSGTVPRSASCMDYNRGNVDELIEPGIYDIEAIRFAYGSKVKTDSGETLVVNTKKSLTSQTPKGQLKPLNELKIQLKYCTDEHASFGQYQGWDRQIDPLCARHDHGDTPLAIVQENIDSINAYRAMHGYRYDREFINNGFRQGFSLFSRNFMPLKKIYSQWRYHLATFVGKENRYLENYTEQELALILNQMKSDKGEHGKNYKDYYEAAQLAYSYLKDLAFTTAKYCIVTADTLPQGVELLEFESLQENVYKDMNKVTMQECEEPIVQTWVQTKYGETAKVVASTGENVNDIKVNLDPTSIEFLENNIAGFDTTRWLAFITMTMRSNDMFHLQNLDFAPNFLDREKNYLEVGNLLLTRSLNGFTPQNSKLGISGQFQYLKFKRENKHLAEMMNMYMNAVFIPGNPDAGSRRAGFMQTYVTDDESIIPESFLKTRYGSLFIAAHPQAAISGNLVRKRSELQFAQEIGKSELIPAPPALDAIKKTIAPVEQVLPAAAKVAEETFTLADLVTVSKSVAKQLEEVKEQDQAQFLAGMFGAHVAIAGAADQGIFTEEDLAGSAKTAINETFGAFFSQNFGAMLQEGQTPIDLFTKEFAAQVPGVIEAINQQRAIQLDYINNREDRDAQLNMVTDMLLRFGGRRGVL